MAFRAGHLCLMLLVADGHRLIWRNLILTNPVQSASQVLIRINTCPLCSWSPFCRKGYTVDQHNNSCRPGSRGAARHLLDVGVMRQQGPLAAVDEHSIPENLRADPVIVPLDAASRKFRFFPVSLSWTRSPFANLATMEECRFLTEMTQLTIGFSAYVVRNRAKIARSAPSGKSVRHQDGDRHRLQYFASSAAKDNLSHPRVPVAAHHNQRGCTVGRK